jgi:hypothetical protein
MKPGEVILPVQSMTSVSSGRGDISEAIREIILPDMKGSDSVGFTVSPSEEQGAILKEDSLLCYSSFSE